MLGALISAGASILGGLVGGDEESKTKQKTKTHSRSASTTKAHLGQMVRQAEKAGFNPLTVLRAGGLAAFSHTTGTSFSNSKMKGSGSSSSSSPLGAGIAAAGSAIGGAMDTGPSEQAINSAAAWQAGAPAAGTSAGQAEYDALASQLKQVQPGTLGTQPRARAAAVETVDAPPLASKAGVFPAEKGVYEKGKVVNPLPFDIPDTVRSADDWESLFSEPGGWVGGFDNAVKIANHHGWGVPQFKKDMARGYNALVDKVTAPIKESDYLPSSAKAAQKMIWDPPAISMFLPPVVETKPVPDMYKDPFPSWGW